MPKIKVNRSLHVVCTLCFARGLNVAMDTSGKREKGILYTHDTKYLELIVLVNLVLIR